MSEQRRMYDLTEAILEQWARRVFAYSVPYYDDAAQRERQRQEIDEIVYCARQREMIGGH